MPEVKYIQFSDDPQEEIESLLRFLGVGALLFQYGESASAHHGAFYIMHIFNDAMKNSKNAKRIREEFDNGSLSGIVSQELLNIGARYVSEIESGKDDADAMQEISTRIQNHYKYYPGEDLVLAPKATLIRLRDEGKKPEREAAYMRATDGLPLFGESRRTSTPEAFATPTSTPEAIRTPEPIATGTPEAIRTPEPIATSTPEAFATQTSTPEAIRTPEAPRVASTPEAKKSPVRRKDVSPFAPPPGRAESWRALGNLASNVGDFLSDALTLKRKGYDAPPGGWTARRVPNSFAPAGPGYPGETEVSSLAPFAPAGPGYPGETGSYAPAPFAPAGESYPGETGTWSDNSRRVVIVHKTAHERGVEALQYYRDQGAPDADYKAAFAGISNYLALIGSLETQYKDADSAYKALDGQMAKAKADFLASKQGPPEAKESMWQNSEWPRSFAIKKEELDKNKAEIGNAILKQTLDFTQLEAAIYTKAGSAGDKAYEYGHLTVTDPVTKTTRLIATRLNKRTGDYEVYSPTVMGGASAGEQPTRTALDNTAVQSAANTLRGGSPTTATSPFAPGAGASGAPGGFGLPIAGLGLPIAGGGGGGGGGETYRPVVEKRMFIVMEGGKETVWVENYDALTGGRLGQPWRAGPAESQIFLQQDFQTFVKKGNGDEYGVTRGGKVVKLADGTPEEKEAYALSLEKTKADARRQAREDALAGPKDVYSLARQAAIDAEAVRTAARVRAEERSKIQLKEQEQKLAELVAGGKLSVPQALRFLGKFQEAAIEVERARQNFEAERGRRMEERTKAQQFADLYETEDQITSALNASGGAQGQQMNVARRAALAKYPGTSPGQQLAAMRGFDLSYKDPGLFADSDAYRGMNAPIVPDTFGLKSPASIVSDAYAGVPGGDPLGDFLKGPEYLNYKRALGEPEPVAVMPGMPEYFSTTMR